MRRLDDLVLETAARLPHVQALRLPDGRCLTYAELVGTATAVAKALDAADDPGPLALVWASRSVGAYAGLLGTVVAGRGYVPLHPELPDERLRRLVERAGSRVLVLDRLDAEAVAPRAASWGVRTLVAVGPDGAEVVGTTPAGTAGTGAAQAGSADADGDLAYLLFTSGSTGEPKAVPIRHRNVVPYVEHTRDRYGVRPGEACSQTFDLTFDPSVFCIFMTWAGGGTLAVPSRHDLLAPGAWIAREQLALWNAVPSLAAFMRRFGQLAPGAYPHLRTVLMGGEPLPVTTARAWAAAAPEAVVENLYGPTEATITATGYRWDGSERWCENGIVPIGWPCPGMSTAVVDEDLREVPPGRPGELLLAGPQVADGYWGDPERTERSFLSPARLGLPDGPTRWYRTGDRVRRPASPGDPLVHLGRLDDQVKLLGRRVELGEVEAVAREVLAREGVVAVPWPPNGSGYAGLELFAAGEETAADQHALRRMADQLPPYMVPRRLTVLPTLPLNGNGKYDRNALRRQLEERDA